MPNILLDEQDILNRMGLALDMMGFSTTIVEDDQYPPSLESKLPGYEHLPVDMVMLMLPVQETLDNQAQVMQIYYSLWDDPVPTEKYDELIALCNQHNMSTMVGVFGVQCDLARLCYKQGVMIPAGIGMDNALSLIMQNALTMAITLDKVYDSMLAILRA